jgi:surfactin synthase thioesterase subunit
MGALVAFEVSCALPKQPIEIYLSAMNAPTQQQLSNYKQLSQLKLELFIKKVESFGGIPKSLMEQEDLLELFALKIQNDFKLLSTIDSRIFNIKSTHKNHILIGIDDQLTDMNTSKNWMNYFNKSINFKLFKGDHFYIFDQSAQVQAYLVAQK